MTRSIFALLCVTLLGSSVFADDLPVPERVFFPDRATALERFRWYGEEHVFSVRLLGTEAVRAGIEVGQRSTDPELGPVVPIHIVGTTVGFFDTVYPIDNESLTLLGVEQNLLPVYTDSDFNERDYVTRLLIIYERDDYRHTTIRIRPDEPDAEEVVVIPEGVYDDLSMIYDVRSRDLTPGNAYVYYTHDGDEFSRLTITSLSVEEIFTDLFGYIDCYEISWVVEPLETAPMLPFGDTPLPPTYRADGEPDEVAVSYFTADERRVMIGTDIETSLGLMTIRVAQYRPPSTPERAPSPTEAP